MQEMKTVDTAMTPLRTVQAPEDLHDRVLVSLTTAPPHFESAPRLRQLVPPLLAAGFLVAMALLTIFSSGQEPPARGTNPIDVIPRPDPDGKGPPHKGLALALKMKKEVFSYKEPVEFEVNFMNVSDKGLSFHSLELEPHVEFPQVKITGQGTTYLVYVSPVQTMWTEGVMVGHLVSLKPGEKKSFAVNADRFALPGSKGDPVVLPPGSYRATATYDKLDNTVLVSGKAFSYVTETIEGLWTGSVESGSVPFTVAASGEILCLLNLSTLDEAVRVELINPFDRELKVEAEATVSVVSKAYGSGRARITLGTPGNLPGDHLIDVLAAGCRNLEEGKTFPIVLPARSSGVYAIYLSHINWENYDKKKPSPVGIHELVGGGGSFSLGIRYKDGEGRKEISAGPIQIRLDVTSGPDLSDHVQLALSSPKDRFRVGEEIQILSVLSPKEGKDVMINERFSFPSELCFEITDPEGKRSSHNATTVGHDETGDMIMRSDLDTRIVAPHAWAGDRIPIAPPLSKSDFGILKSGEQARLKNSLDVNAAVDGGLKPGRYRIQAFYRNRDPGRRFGLETPALVGRVASNSIDIEVTE